MYQFWNNIENYRLRLLHNDQFINVLDFGAGSMVDTSKQRKINAIAKSGLLSAAWGRRLAVLRQRMPTGPVLELGTSFGITTAYLATISEEPIVTLEGCPDTLSEAQRAWHHLGVTKRIRPILGNIDETLTQALEQGPFSLIVLDANHRYEPTLRYFEAVLPHLHPEGCIVIDDIYWTPEMTEAWQALKSHKAVRQSIDLYRQGWLFFRDGQAPEHFSLRG